MKLQDAGSSPKSPLEDLPTTRNQPLLNILDAECSMGYLINSVTRLLLRAVDHELRPLNITAAQLAPLLALSEQKSMLQRDLVKRLGVTQPAIVVTLAKLERESLIDRHPDERDGRASLISLTPKGQELVQAALPALHASNARALAGFSKSEEEDLRVALRRILIALGE